MLPRPGAVSCRGDRRCSSTQLLGELEQKLGGVEAVFAGVCDRARGRTHGSTSRLWRALDRVQGQVKTEREGHQGIRLECRPTIGRGVATSRYNLNKRGQCWGDRTATVER